MFLLALRRLWSSMVKDKRAPVESKPLTAFRCSIRTVMGMSPCIRMEPSTLQTGDFRCSMMVCMEPVHLIVGDDEFLAERARRSIQKAVAEETGEQPELKILRSEERRVG